MDSFFCNSFVCIIRISWLFTHLNCAFPYFVFFFKCKSNKNSNNCNKNILYICSFMHWRQCSFLSALLCSVCVSVCLPLCVCCLFVYVIQFNLCLFIFISYPNGWRNYVNESKTAEWNHQLYKIICCCYILP